jgi:branched-chain amino acid transport system permease protein
MKLESLTKLWNNKRVLIITSVIVIMVVGIITQSMEPKVWMSILLSGITLAALYFLVASGLSLIFGLMDVLNFAHGGIFVLGAYVGLSTFMNPRLLFNTIPFFLAVIAGAILGNYYGVYLWRRIDNKNLKKVIWWLLMVFGAGVIVFALRRFPIRPLNAFNVTAVGGIVPTEVAQEAMAVMVQRVAMLVVGGLPFGIMAAPKYPHEEGRRKPAWQIIIASVFLIAAAYTILFLRDTGETFMLGLPVDIRFLLALIVGSLAGILVGIAIEIVLIRPFYGQPVTQLVLTLGLSIVIIDLIEGIWGEEGNPPMQPPSFFNESCRSESLLLWFSENCSSIDVFGRAFPTYRLFIITIGVLTFVGVALLLRRTRIGMIIRAGVQDSEMVQALGINVRQVFTQVFALGSGLAALGGVIAAPFLGVYPGMAATFNLQAFIAVVIGGMGSFAGAAIGTLLLGLARAFGDHFVASGFDLPFMETTLKGSPAIAKASTVLIMAIVLLVRPAGIFGKKE